MKLLYEGKTMFDPMHVQRQRRRAWFKGVCWELLGALAFCLGMWGFTILMFVM